MIVEAIVTNAVLSILLLVIIYILDRQEKEPPLTVARVYLLSILATWLFGRAKLLLGVPVHAPFGPAFDAFVLAGALEETLKLGLFMALVWRLPSFDEEMDGVVYAMVVAAGFAVMENVYYTVHASLEAYRATGAYHGAMFTILAIRALPGHILFAVVGGYCLGRARFARRGRLSWIVAAWASSVALHGTWNYLAWTDAGPFLAYATALLASCWILLAVAQRRTRYFALHGELRARIDRCLATPAVCPDAEMRGALAAVAVGLRHLRGLEGREQDELAAWMRERLPDPEAAEGGGDEAGAGSDGRDVDDAAVATGDVLARVREIAAALEARRGRFDAGFLLGFGLLLIGPSSVLLLVLMLV